MGIIKKVSNNHASTYPIQRCDWAGQEAGYQSSAGLTQKERQPFPHTVIVGANVETPDNLMCMPLDCRKKPEYLKETHTGRGRTAHGKAPAG